MNSIRSYHDPENNVAPSPNTLYENISVLDYKTRFKDAGNAHLLLDVRTVEEFEEARIPGAVNVPLDQLQDSIDDVLGAAGGAPVVVVCRTGVRSIMGATILRYCGLNNVAIYNLETGTQGWARERLPLDSGPI